MALFSQSDMDKLSGPHVARCWFGEFDLPSGMVRYHNGVGTVSANGHEWQGITDPVGGQMVGVSSIEDPRFGQASKVDIVIGGVDAAFYKSMKTNARDIEGREANIYFGMFDPETAELIMFRKVIGGGFMSSPSLHRQGIGTRYIVLTVEGFWEAQNFPFGGRWTAADQKRRHPGDKGLDLVGVKISEPWQ